MVDILWLNTVDMQLEIERRSINEEKHIGLHEIHVSVIDEDQTESKITIHLQIFCTPEVAIPSSFDVPIISPDPPRPYISKINDVGRVWVKFGRKIKYPDLVTQESYL